MQFTSQQKKPTMNRYRAKYRWNPQGKELKPKGIVIHAMMEEIMNKRAWDFLYEDQGLSVHACIAEDTHLFEAGFAHKIGEIDRNYMENNGLMFDDLLPEYKYLGKGNPVLIECQEDDKVAYHAGKSQHGSLTNLNYHYLGVELLVNKQPYMSTLHSKNITDPHAQLKFIINNIDWVQARVFDVLVDWCHEKMVKYDIPIENVVQHSDVSGDNVRGKGKGKFDAGKAFNQYIFYKRLQEKLTGEIPTDSWIKKLIENI